MHVDALAARFAESTSRAANPDDQVATGPPGSSGDSPPLPHAEAKDALYRIQRAQEQAAAAFRARVMLPDQATAETLSSMSAAVTAARNAALSDLADARHSLQQPLNAYCQRLDHVECSLNRRPSALQLRGGEAEEREEARQDAQVLPELLSGRHLRLQAALESLAAARSALGACLGEPDQATLIVGPAEALVRLRVCHAAGAAVAGQVGILLEMMQQARALAALHADNLDSMLARLRLAVRALQTLVHSAL